MAFFNVSIQIFQSIFRLRAIKSTQNILLFIYLDFNPWTFLHDINPSTAATSSNDESDKNNIFKISSLTSDPQFQKLEGFLELNLA